MSNSEQTVADATKSGSQTPDAGAGAQDDEDLDTVLAEFSTSSQVQGQSTVDAQSTTGDDKSRLDRLEAELAQERQKNEAARNESLRERAEAAVSETVGQIRAQLPEGTHIPDRALRGWIEMEAQSRPELVQAFVTRTQNPKKWEKVVAALARELASEIPDAKATADRNAVVSAVRSASTTAPATGEGEPFDEAAVRKMSVAQLREKFPGLNK